MGSTTYMDEPSVLFIDLHQLLVCFVPHTGLWVCSHGNEVWNALQTTTKSYISKEILCNALNDGLWFKYKANCPQCEIPNHNKFLSILFTFLNASHYDILQ